MNRIFAFFSQPGNQNSRLTKVAAEGQSKKDQNNKNRSKSETLELKKNKIEHFLLVLILVISAFFRLYKIGDLLGFWYDQGRDALVIWNLIHDHKLFLIGPVTGIEGIFLGPFYYYLMAPFYWLGKGDPVIASAGIASFNVAAVFLIYLLAQKMFNPKVGLLASFLYGFSYNNVLFSRWLANPSPLPFFAMIVLYFLFEFIEGKSKSLIWALFFIGLCLQLEAASAVFFIPSVLIVIFWQRSKVTFRVVILSFLVFFVTLLPQIIFNFRHQGILAEAFKKFLLEEKSFRLNFIALARERLLVYYDAFTSKIFPSVRWLKAFVIASFSASAIIFRKKAFNHGGKLLLVWLAVPLCGYLFYQGNNGYLWNYYFAGVIPAFMILFAAGLYFLFEKNIIYKAAVCLFLFLFLCDNIHFLRGFYGVEKGITLRSEKRAVDWIYNDAGDQSFNIDVYVPPKIYYSYTYLFKWYGMEKYGREPNNDLVENLYTLYEPDGEHPQFLDQWLKRQDKIGKIIKDEYSWGGITVQKRKRILYEHE